MRELKTEDDIRELIEEYEVEFIDYNTIRSLSYFDEAPIIMYELD